ncbi:hypothetical protein CEXT_782061 [Caerostris extrusa]|uniref:Uncharacterized protein n=1 Tax=Caerostris extrusa TaxID=172846 RepID=A0AAV4VQS8_CAEEX|nr:hypothetical protein CEXT_782061 [Caerostris extrusa]
MIWSFGQSLKRKCKNKISDYKLFADLNALEDWCDTNNMEVNLKKSYYLTFLFMHQALDLQLVYRGTQIATSNSFKYLGVTIDRKLNWKPHTEDITNRAMKRLRALKLLDGTRWSCTGLTLLQTYHAFIRPF